jgi:hypothetical protein
VRIEAAQIVSHVARLVNAKDQNEAGLLAES